MNLALLDISLIVLSSAGGGAIISRYLTAKEWREHCEQNDARWHNYHKRLIEEDIEIMVERQNE